MTGTQKKLQRATTIRHINDDKNECCPNCAMVAWVEKMTQDGEKAWLCAVCRDVFLPRKDYVPTGACVGSYFL